MKHKLLTITILYLCICASLVVSDDDDDNEEEEGEEEEEEDESAEEVKIFIHFFVLILKHLFFFIVTISYGSPANTHARTHHSRTHKVNRVHALFYWANK